MIRKILLALILVGGAYHAPAEAQSPAAVGVRLTGVDADQPLASRPHRKPDGSRWRFGYYEGGPWETHDATLEATLRELIATGWVEPMEFPAVVEPGPGGLWRWLAAHARSDYVEFPADGYYSAGDLDARKRPTVRRNLLERVRTRGDLDLVLAFGAWAAEDLAAGALPIPVVVAAVRGPLEGGISPSGTGSGQGLPSVAIEPTRIEQAVELFARTFRFRRLGIVYEDSAEGRRLAAVKEISRVARQRDFEIVSCFAPYNNVTLSVSEALVAACYERVSQASDAVVVTRHRGVTAASLRRIVTVLNARRLPSFSTSGEDEVRQGVLMSMARPNLADIGRLHARSILAILDGAQPPDPPRSMSASTGIAINLRTAQTIGYDPSVDVLLDSEEIVRDAPETR